MTAPHSACLHNFGGGHSAFFSAFTFDVDDSGAVVGGADVADVGLAELIGAEAG